MGRRTPGWTDNTQEMIISVIQDLDVIHEIQDSMMRKSRKRMSISFYITKTPQKWKQKSNDEKFQAALWIWDSKPTAQAVKLKYGCHATVVKMLSKQFVKIISQHEKIAEEGLEDKKSRRGEKFEEFEACHKVWIQDKTGQGKRCIFYVGIIFLLFTWCCSWDFSS
jgi:hypothetical protein